jgi:hypothetical protein
VQYRPDAKEILLAIQDLLLKEILPKIESDDLLSYKSLVSWNMLGVLAREYDKEEDFIKQEFDALLSLSLMNGEINHTSEEFLSLTKKEKSIILQSLSKSLAKAIRSSKVSTIDSPIWDHIKVTLKNNLAISNPRFIA